MTKHLVVPDPHAHPDYNNNRAIWLGKLIIDEKPDVVVMLGDMADIPSLCSYDKGKKSFQGRSYKKDIDAHLDFQDKLWSTVKQAKKRLPRRVCLIGNHEQRIARAIDIQPELEGTISYDDLSLSDFYDEVVHYDGASPGTIEIDGIHYAHYLVSGVSGRPISSGENMAGAMLSKRFVSSTVGHLHTFDFGVRTRGDGKKIAALCAGVYQDYKSDFAGAANDLWWRGVAVKENVENGFYDLKMVSLASIKKEYK